MRWKWVVTICVLLIIALMAAGYVMLGNYDYNKQTKISGNLHLDSGSPPQLATNFLVQNFDLGNLLKETGVSDQIRAVVDIAAHGKSSGDSVQSLMANLDGSIGAVMGEGYLTRYLDMLSINLSQKVNNFWGQHKGARQIECAVVQFDIKKGIATGGLDSGHFRDAGFATSDGRVVNTALGCNPLTLLSWLLSPIWRYRPAILARTKDKIGLR